MRRFSSSAAARLGLNDLVVTATVAIIWWSLKDTPQQ